jgi:hypothetical protein
MIEPNFGWRRRRGWVFCAILGMLAAGGCTHRTTPAGELQAGVAPLTHTKDQTTALVATEKHSLGAEDLNSLTVAYTALEEKGNAYADFLVESVSVTSFDAGRNARCAQNLTEAVNGFNKAFTAIASPKRPVAPIQSAWIPAFAANIQAYWAKYSTALAAMSPQTKADLIKQLKSETVWPNYEDIATEPVAGTPH